MKRNNFLPLAILCLVGSLMLVGSGCQDPLPSVLYDSGDHIRFQDPSTTLVSTDANPRALPLIFTKTSNVPATVNVTIQSESNQVFGTDYALATIDPSTGTLQYFNTTPVVITFSGEEFMDTLYFVPFPGGGGTGDKEVVLEISSPEVPVGFPGPDANNSTHVISICASENIIGAYDAVSNGVGSNSNGGADPFPVNGLAGVVNFSAGANPGEYVLDDPSFGVYPQVYNVDTPPAGTVVNECNILAMNNYTDQYGDPFTFSGTVDPTSGAIVIDWFNTWGDNFNVVLSPQ